MAKGAGGERLKAEGQWAQAGLSAVLLGLKAPCPVFQERHRLWEQHTWRVLLGVNTGVNLRSVCECI